MLTKKRKRLRKEAFLNQRDKRVCAARLSSNITKAVDDIESGEGVLVAEGFAEFRQWSQSLSALAARCCVVRNL
jgi:hypothetical protein